MDILARWLVPKYIFPGANLAVICITAPIEKVPPCKYNGNDPLSTTHPTFDFDVQHRRDPYTEVSEFESMPLKDALRVMFRTNFDTKAVASWRV